MTLKVYWSFLFHQFRNSLFTFFFFLYKWRVCGGVRPRHFAPWGGMRCWVMTSFDIVTITTRETERQREGSSSLWAFLKETFYSQFRLKKSKAFHISRCCVASFSRCWCIAAIHQSIKWTAIKVWPLQKLRSTEFCNWKIFLKKKISWWQNDFFFLAFCFAFLEFDIEKKKKKKIQKCTVIDRHRNRLECRRESKEKEKKNETVLISSSRQIVSSLYSRLLLSLLIQWESWPSLNILIVYSVGLCIEPRGGKGGRPAEYHPILYKEDATTHTDTVIQ